MVDPNQIAAVESNGITAPNIFRVQVSDSDVLDDDVCRAAAEAETFAFDATSRALSQDGLVGCHIDRRTGCFVPGALNRWRLAAVVLNDLLASTSGAPARAGCAGFRSFKVCEVKDLVQDDNARS